MPEPKVPRAKRSPPFKRGMLLKFKNPTSKTMRGTWRMSRFSYDSKLCRITKVGSGAILFVEAELLESTRVLAEPPKKRPLKRADILARAA